MNNTSTRAVFLEIHASYVNAMYQMSLEALTYQSNSLIQLFSGNRSPAQIAVEFPRQMTDYRGIALEEWRVSLIEIFDDRELESDGTLSFESEDLYSQRDSTLSNSCFLNPVDFSLRRNHFSKRDHCVDVGSILNRINKVARVGFLHNFPIKLNIHYHFQNGRYPCVDHYRTQFNIEASHQTNRISINRYPLSKLISDGVLTSTPIAESCAIM